MHAIARPATSNKHQKDTEETLKFEEKKWNILKSWLLINKTEKTFSPKIPGKAIFTASKPNIFQVFRSPKKQEQRKLG